MVRIKYIFKSNCFYSSQCTNISNFVLKIVNFDNKFNIICKFSYSGVNFPQGDKKSVSYSGFFLIVGFLIAGVKQYKIKCCFLRDYWKGFLYRFFFLIAGFLIAGIYCIYFIVKFDIQAKGDEEKWTMYYFWIAHFIYTGWPV